MLRISPWGVFRPCSGRSANCGSFPLFTPDMLRISPRGVFRPCSGRSANCLNSLPLNPQSLRDSPEGHAVSLCSTGGYRRDASHLVSIDNQFHSSISPCCLWYGLADNWLCVSWIWKPRAAQREHAVCGNAWFSLSSVPGIYGDKSTYCAILPIYILVNFTVKIFTRILTIAPTR